jgi:hypothetical protein
VQVSVLFIVKDYRWKFGPVRSKVISLITFASMILTPLSNAHAAFGDGSPTVPNTSVFTGNPITKKDPTGRDALSFNFTVGAEGGFGFYAGGQLNFGGTYVYNPETGQRWLVPTISTGTTGGKVVPNACTPEFPNGAPMVIGASGGAGISVGYSPYVTSPSEVAGTQNSVNINAAFGSAFVQGEGTKSATYGLAFGRGGGASVSSYPVTTWTANSNIYSWMGQNQTTYNQNRTPNAPSYGQQGTTGSSGGGSSAQLIGLYQSLVATLTTYVNVLSASKPSR